MSQAIFHHRGDLLEDGSILPVYIYVDGEKKKVGNGVYDTKNHFVTCNIDPTTEEGRRVAELVVGKSLGELSLG